ncbi:hypothetical protein QE250_00625 [Chromatiaceae bacterium AAb-1]|nr:hypothetical protein [Chromatiaceae bacterium AAb-1]
MIALPLVLLAAATASYSPSERRTLQEAVTVQLYANQLQAFHKLCASNASDSLPAIDTEQLNDLLQQQIGLNSEQFQVLLQEQPATRALAGKELITLRQDCQDTAAYQNLFDSYELKRFSLEIATPLPETLQNNSSLQHRVNQQKQAELTMLLSKSKSVVTAVISNRNKLTPIEQANYLHPDYQGPYLFRIEQGWRNNTPPFIGLHLYVDNSNIGQTPQKWLLFLDQNNHIIEAKPYTEVEFYIQQLGKPDWQLDSSGNIQRN